MHKNFESATQAIGKFQHSDLRFYSPNDMHPIRGRTHQEVYDKTMERESFIRFLGFNVSAIWESYFVFKKKINDIKSF